MVVPPYAEIVIEGIEDDKTTGVHTCSSVMATVIGVLNRKPPVYKSLRCYNRH